MQQPAFLQGKSDILHRQLIRRRISQTTVRDQELEPLFMDGRQVQGDKLVLSIDVTEFLRRSNIDVIGEVAFRVCCMSGNIFPTTGQKSHLPVLSSRFCPSWIKRS